MRTYRTWMPATCVHCGQSCRTQGRPCKECRRGFTPACLVPSTAELAWAAGIYEGEGSVSRLSSGSPIMRVYQKDEWLPRRLLALFGGHCTSRKGNVLAPDSLHWIWALYGERARMFLMQIFGFLSPRRQAQIRLALYGSAPGG